METAGHYHRTVVSRLLAAAYDVVELNPAHVKAARSAHGDRAVKNDLRDAAAIVDLVIRGAGRSPQQRSQALVTQQVWASLRSRRIQARTALTNQLLGTLDLVFPGLDGCFDSLLETKVGPVLLGELADPDRMCRLGVEGLRAFTAARGVQLQRRKAEQLHQAATDALRLPAAERACRAEVLAADLALLTQLDAQLEQAQQRLAGVLSDTPAAVLVTLPGVGVVRASNYGAALGDPFRFGTADQAYRFAGLVPTSYESAGRARGEQTVSREGSAQLRNAIVELGPRAGPTRPRLRPVPHRPAHSRDETATGRDRRRTPSPPTGLRDDAQRPALRPRPARPVGRQPRREENQDQDGWARQKLHREAACRRDVTHPPSTTVPRRSPSRKTRS